MHINSIETLNKLNREFWEGQRILMEERLSNDSLVKGAIYELTSKDQRCLPVSWRMSFEIALEHSENHQNVYKKYFAVKGGKAPKEDALQKYIIYLVKENPNITRSELFYKIKRELKIGGDFIEDVTDLIISFIDTDKEIKNAPLSGLKDRLSRAKKKISRANP